MFETETNIPVPTSSLYLFSFLNILQTRYENGENHEAMFPFVYNSDTELFMTVPCISEYNGRTEEYDPTDDEINSQSFELDYEQLKEIFNEFLSYMDSVNTAEQQLGFDLKDYVTTNFETMVHVAMNSNGRLLVGFDITMNEGELIFRRWLSPTSEDGSIDVIEEHMSYFYPEVGQATEGESGEDAAGTSVLGALLHERLQRK